MAKLSLISLLLSALSVSGATSSPAPAPAPAPAHVPPCTLPTRTLPTVCNGMCTEERDACVMYEKATDCSNSTDVGGQCMGVSPVDRCAYECIAMFPVVPSQAMKLYISSGKYKSPQEQWSEVHDPNWRYKIQKVGNDVVTYAYPAINNDKIDVIGSLSVPETVSSVEIFGRESDYGVNGRVANVSITTDMIPSHVKTVSLMNLNIAAQLEQSLTKYMPATLTYLDISNTMLTTLPSDLDQFTSVATLYTDQNNITHVPASLTLPSVLNMSMTLNKIESFEGNYPNVKFLSLNNNSLTSIPPVIYTMKKLQQLDLSFNLLDNVTLNQTEFNFLNSIPSLSVTGSFNTDCASPAVLRDTGGNKIKVCVHDHARAGDQVDAKSKSSVGVIVGIVGGVVAFIAIAGLVIWKRRKTSTPQPIANHSMHGQKGDTNNMSTAYSDATDRPVDSDLLSSEPILRMHRLEADDIRDLRQLGAGAFGVVWLVTYRGKQSLASKRLKASDVNQDQIDRFLDEIRLTARLEHANIVRFVGVAWTRLSDVQALYEYMENGDLRNWLKHTDASIGWRREKLQIAINVVEALVYVHSFSPPIVHRDLKSSNVLLDTNTTAKLCDFGVARLQSTQQTMTMGVGTSFWLAPEVIIGQGDYGCRADMYSFGVLLSELDTHCIPYEAVLSETGNRLPDIAILHQVGCGKLQPSFSDSCLAEVKELGFRCLAFDPSMRPTAMEVSFALSRMMK